MKFEFSEQFARKMDEDDPLKDFSDHFFYPKIDGGKAIYFCGNSLGLQPKLVQRYLQMELDAWAEKGVEGHFAGKSPWLDARLRSKPILAAILGAKEQEVVAMGSLTANLHLLMVSFYQPTPKRFKIITEADAFPSDQYLLESQVRFHGFDPKEAIVEIKPRSGEHVLRNEDILLAIKENSEELALVFMSGVQYYTGQFFSLQAIAEAGIKAGAKVGFDLAHAAGNVPLRLHDWGVDFAAWCSYKYLNSGPGNVGGIFVHEKHAHQSNLQRFAGWWGHDEKERFKMEGNFKPMTGVDGWQVSNNNVLALAAHQASLELFEKAGMARIRHKSELLTGYLEFLVQEIAGGNRLVEIISPKDPKERGCQLSLLIPKGGREVFDALSRQGVVSDWRNPNVVRLAPTPLYNTFAEVFRFAGLFEQALQRIGLKERTDEK
ncbi:MAG TPA: kynureninase [Cyclobacteriaceae bacterium]|nr:kynureninase [Cyclobacteriaceae bacterium]